MPDPVAGKPPADSRVEMTQIVLPGMSNALGTAFGGTVVQWIDIAGAVAARRHCGRIAVTASMDSVQFLHPVQLGDTVVLRSSVNRAWRTSMEVGVRVESETDDGRRHHAASAYVTFVAVDQGRPCAVPAVEPATEVDQRRFEQAALRRAHRLRSRRNTAEPAPEPAAEPALEPANAPRGSDTVIGRLAHDLKNSLAVVLSNSAYLQGQVGDPELSEAVDETALAAERLVRIIDDAADLQILHSGQLAPHLVVIELKALVDPIKRGLRQYLDTREIHFNLPALTLRTDPRLLTRILINIIEHSVRRTPRSGFVSVDAAAADERLSLRVTDSAPPFAPDREPSFLAAALPPSAPPEKGFRSDDGLGLFFAGMAARALQGRIAIQPREDRQPGLVFQIDLPAGR